MIPTVIAHRAEISALCRRFNVHRLDVFGSAVRENEFSETSDIDFLVEFDPTDIPSIAGVIDLRDALASLLGRDVDLTMAGAVRNPFLRAAIERSRVPLYSSFPRKRESIDPFAQLEGWIPAFAGITK